MPVKVINSGTWQEVGTDIAVLGKYDKFVGFFQIINMVIILCLQFMQSIRRGDDFIGGRQIFFGRGKAHFDTVLFVMADVLVF